MVPGCGRPGAKHRHEVRPEEAPRPRVATEGLCGTSGGTRMCGSPTAAKAPRASPARGQGAATPAPPRGAQRAVGCGEPQPQRGKPRSASRAGGLAAWGPGVPARLGAGPGCRLQLAGAAHAAVGGLGWAGLGWVGAAAADSYGAIAQTCLTGTAPCGSACAPRAAADAYQGGGTGAGMSRMSPIFIGGWRGRGVSPPAWLGALGEATRSKVGFLQQKVENFGYTSELVVYPKVIARRWGVCEADKGKGPLSQNKEGG